MELHITSHEALTGFPDLLKRVRENGDAFIIEEGGRGVCAITPINGTHKTTLADLANLLRSSPPVDEEYLSTLEHHLKSVNDPSIPESRWGS